MVAVCLPPLAPQGYNKRATVHYMLGNYEESIHDCKMVLQLQVGPCVCVCRSSESIGVPAGAGT